MTNGLTLREVTRENWRAALNLAVHPEQQRFIADYVPIAASTLVDDFVIPLVARLKNGKAIIYESDAVAWEETPPEIADEFRRRTREESPGQVSVRVRGATWLKKPL